MGPCTCLPAYSPAREALTKSDFELVTFVGELGSGYLHQLQLLLFSLQILFHHLNPGLSCVGSFLEPKDIFAFWVKYAQSVEAQAALFKAADSQLPNKTHKPLHQDGGKMCWGRRFKFHPIWVITASKLNQLPPP